MEIKLYNWEKQNRPKRWYIVFWWWFVFFIIILLLISNIFGAIILMMILGGYLLFSMETRKKITCTIAKEWLRIDKKMYAWTEVTGFALELWENDTKTLKNIVFFIWNNTLIHTFDDDYENIKAFLEELSDYVAMYSEYNQSFIDKLIRKLKL